MRLFFYFWLHSLFPADSSLHCAQYPATQNVVKWFLCVWVESVWLEQHNPLNRVWRRIQQQNHPWKKGATAFPHSHSNQHLSRQDILGVSIKNYAFHPRFLHKEHSFLFLRRAGRTSTSLKMHLWPQTKLNRWKGSIFQNNFCALARCGIHFVPSCTSRNHSPMCLNSSASHLKNCTRKWCLFFCSILFDVTWEFSKMCHPIKHILLDYWNQIHEITLIRSQT